MSEGLEGWMSGGLEGRMIEDGANVVSLHYRIPPFLHPFTDSTWLRRDAVCEEGLLANRVAR
jgi:hypothetical protein